MWQMQEAGEMWGRGYKDSRPTWKAEKGKAAIFFSISLEGAQPCQPF